MFRELSRDDEIAAFVNDVLREEPDDFRRRFIVALSHLSPVGWAALEQFVGDMTTRKLNPAPHAWRTFKPARPEDWLPDLEELDSPDAGIPPPSEPNRHLDAPPRAAPGWTPEKHAVWEAEARAEAERVYREILEEKKAESESSAFPPGGSGTA